MKDAEQLDREILALIEQGLDRRDEEQFERLALDLFAYQFTHNQPYQNFCRRRGREPSDVSSWRDIPAVPTTAFKESALVCFPISESATVFETSGTTGGGSRRGRHYLQTTRLYDTSIRPNFAAHLLPDGARLPLLILTPPPSEAPHSSLVHMMEVVGQEFGAAGHHYFVHHGHLEVRHLADVLRMAEGFAEPVLLLGTAFAFVHFLDWCAAQGQMFRLPPGSRVMETGGFKGRSRELSRANFYGWLEEYLSLPPSHIVNEYGMTELGVQFYDEKLRRPQSSATNKKTVPPWARVLIVDPATGREVADGERGLICVYDLTNRGSVLAIQTEDVGIRLGEGFEVVGRAAGAEARGCSLAAEEFLESNR